MNKLVMTVAAGALALAPRAYADSCESRVAEVMAQHVTYLTYCADCGDAAPSAPLAWMPGQELDAAHAYVQTSPTRYELVSALADCAFESGPAALRVVDETPTGVLIVPDAVPVARVEPPPPNPGFVTVDGTASWLVGVIGGLAGSLVTLVTLVGCMRRRKSHVRIGRWAD